MRHLLICSEALIKCGVCGAIFLIPLYFDTKLHNVFDLSKLVCMYIICLLILIGWAIRFILQKKRFYFSPLKWQVLSFFIISAVSVLFSVNKIVSIFGYYRHYEGLLSLICYLILFFSLVNVFEKRSIMFLLNLLLLTAVVCSIYGIIQHLRLDPFSWSGAAGDPNRVSSSFGNPAFFGGYIVMFVPIAFGCLIFSFNKTSFVFYALCFFIVSVGFFLTNARACYIGLFFGLLLFLKQVIKYKITKKAFLYFFIFFIPCVYFNLRKETSAILRFATTFTGKEHAQKVSKIAYQATSHGFEGSAGIRLHIWKDTLKIIKEYPIFGVGLDGLGNVYLKYRSMGVFRIEGDAKADSSHNEFLDIAVTRGIFGLIIYLWLIGSFIYLCIREKTKRQEIFMLFGIACGLVSYFIQTLFSFGTTPVFSTLWLVMGVGCLFFKKEKGEVSPTSIFLVFISIIIGIFGLVSVFSDMFFIYPILIVLFGMLPCVWSTINKKEIHNKISKKRWVIFGIVIFTLSILFPLTIRLYLADVYYKSGIKKEIKEQLKAYEEAVRLNPTIDWYQGELVRLLLEEAKTKRDPKYLEYVIRRIKRTIGLFPQDANNYNTLGLAYDFKGELLGINTKDKAISCYKKAIFWNPFYVGAYNNIGVIYGRAADYEKAERYFTKSLKIEPENATSLENLQKIADAYIFYKKTELAKRVLTNIARFAPRYPKIMEIYTNLGNIYKEQGRMDKIEEICLLMLKSNKNNIIARRNLGSIYFSQKKYKDAKKEFEYVLKIEPNDTYAQNLLARCNEK